LTAAWVLGHRDGGHRLIPNGEVVIDGGEIVFVGSKFSGEVARRIDFGNALVSPGFIDLDALSDLDTTILGIDHHPGWAKGRVWPRSYVERGPYEMYSQEELAFQNASPSASFCSMASPPPHPSPRCSTANGARRSPNSMPPPMPRESLAARLFEPGLSCRRHGA
jgi:hypothetical protein